jgi:hypothetical protein
VTKVFPVRLSFGTVQSKTAVSEGTERILSEGMMSLSSASVSLTPLPVILLFIGHSCLAKLCILVTIKELALLLFRLCNEA